MASTYLREMSLESLVAELRGFHDLTGNWRDVADLYYPTVPAGTLCAIAKGYPVPKRHRAALGLPVLAPAPVCPIHGGVDCLECGKQQRAKGKPRPRLVAQVPAEMRAAVHAAAAFEGVTAADWLRRVVGEALLFEMEGE